MHYLGCFLKTFSCFAYLLAKAWELAGPYTLHNSLTRIPACALSRHKQLAAGLQKVNAAYHVEKTANSLTKLTKYKNGYSGYDC